MTQQPPVQVSLLEMTFEAFNSLIRPSPVKLKPSIAVYAERPKGTLFPYILGAISFLVVGLVISFGDMLVNYIGFAIAGYAAPVVYMVWMIRNDRYEREPIALIAYSFGWGAFSSIFAGILNNFVTGPILGVGGAGFIEEPLKIIGVILIARNRMIGDEFNDHLDGMIYGAAAGAGFAGLENIWYLQEMIMTLGYAPLLAIVLRSATAFMHIAWSAMAGRSIGLAKVYRGKVEWIDLVPGVLVSALIHMVWNLMPAYISLFVIMPFIVSALRQQIKTALQDEAGWGFAYFPPDESQKNDSEV